MYLPLAPLVTAVVLGGYMAGWTLIQRKPALSATVRLSGVCLVAGIVAVLGILTYLRNEDYQSELRMWQDTVAKAPHNYRAYNNLGRALVHEGRFAEAFVHYDKALEINPEYAQTNFNLGLLLVQLGRDAEAIPRLQQNLKINPNDIETHLNLGVAFARLDRIERSDRALSQGTGDRLAIRSRAQQPRKPLVASGTHRPRPWPVTKRRSRSTPPTPNISTIWPSACSNWTRLIAGKPRIRTVAAGCAPMNQPIPTRDPSRLSE